jgi:hypothetical protein
MIPLPLTVVICGETYSAATQLCFQRGEHSGATHPRLTLCSGCLVKFLLSLLVANCNLLNIQFYYTLVINFI